MPNRLIELVDHLPHARVVLLGDLMLDRYVYGNAERLSPEAPVPVLHYQREEYRLGGAGSVAADLAALGAQVQVVGITGNDEDGRRLRHLLSECHADTTGVVMVDNRPTVCKTRLVGLAQHRHPQQMMRIDVENTAVIEQSISDAVLSHLAAALDHADVLCIEDYHKGLLSMALCKHAIELARARQVPVLVDPANIGDYSMYFGATALKLNRDEAEHATGLQVRSPQQAPAAAQWLLDRLDLEAVVITMDKNGAFLSTSDGQHRMLATRARHVYDVTGAGDMVLAVLAVTRAAGATWDESVALANIAGGLEVERFGAVPVTPHEIIAELLSEMGKRMGKRRTLDQLLLELAHYRAMGKKVVFTNGCFDLLHLGHVKYFQFARQQGDLLVVAVNTDASIRRLKGPKRPILNEEDRISMLEEMESIDYVLPFDDDTPIPLLEKIRPEVLVKGADYTRDQVVGHEIVEGYGGTIALAPLIDGHSTSALIQRILEAYKK